MGALWTSEAMEEATLGHASRPFEAQGLSIDTRSLEPGDVFVALKGGRRDGHGFVAGAVARGAAAAIVARAPDGLGLQAPLLHVADTQRALEDLGRAARARTRARIAAVTGSAGKTTTKEMLRLALAAQGATHASPASYNNHWGVPLSVAQMPPDCAFGVFEIGMNHFGEIRALVGFVRPEVALVTTIAPAHLEYFGSLAAIADAKAEIFEGLGRSGAAIVPDDNPCTDRLAARARAAGVARIFTFGGKPASAGRLLSLGEVPEGMRVEADILGRRCTFRIGAKGAHIAHNAVAALLAVALLDGDVERAAAALANFSALKGRGARFVLALSGGEAEIIDESYNANPASMRAAFALLGAAQPGAGGRRIAVLGDMLELGEASVQLHAALADPLADAHADLLFACGPHMGALFEQLPASRRGGWRETSAALAPEVVQAVRAGDVVLVKGSLGSRMAAILDALKAAGGAR